MLSFHLIEAANIGGPSGREPHTPQAPPPTQPSVLPHEETSHKITAAIKIQRAFRQVILQRTQLARLIPHLMQTEDFRQFIGEAAAPSIVSKAPQVAALVRKFSLSKTKCVGKSSRIEFKSWLSGPLDPFCLVERPGNWKSVRVFFVNGKRSAGSGCFKQFYSTRKIELNRASQLNALDAALHTIASTLSAERPDSAILPFLRCETYVYGRIDTSHSNFHVVQKGLEIHKMLADTSLASNRHFPPYPEKPLPDLEKKSSAKWQELLTPWFNCTLDNAIDKQFVPLTDLERCETVDFTLEDQLAIFQQVTDFLKLLHEFGVAHRDVRPNNIGIKFDPVKRKFVAILFDYDFAREFRITFSAPARNPFRDTSTGAGCALPFSDVYGLVMTFVAMMISYDSVPWRATQFNIQETKGIAMKKCYQTFSRAYNLPVKDGASLGKYDDFITYMERYIRENTPDAAQIAIRLKDFRGQWNLMTTVIELLAATVADSTKLHKYIENNQLILETRLEFQEFSTILRRLETATTISLGALTRCFNKLSSDLHIYTEADSKVGALEMPNFETPSV